jgi:hypothetical protein
MSSVSEGTQSKIFFSSFPPVGKTFHTVKLKIFADKNICGKYFSRCENATVPCSEGLFYNRKYHYRKYF